MNIPFTTRQFLDVFRDYNIDVWPMQIIFYLLALVAILLAIEKIRFSKRIIAAILSFFWIWMGIVYHFEYFSNINPVAYIFGILFVIQGLLFLYFGVIKKKIIIRYHSGLSGIIGNIFIFYALVVYPVISYFNGHMYPDSPTFGLPCPTTIFTLGLLLWTNKKLPTGLIIVPVAWTFIGFSAAFQLGITEDIGLIIAGILFIGLAIYKSVSDKMQQHDWVT